MHGLNKVCFCFFPVYNVQYDFDVCTLVDKRPKALWQNTPAFIDTFVTFSNFANHVVKRVNAQNHEESLNSLWCQELCVFMSLQWWMFFWSWEHFLWSVQVNSERGTKYLEESFWLRTMSKKLNWKTIGSKKLLLNGDQVSQVS